MRRFQLIGIFIFCFFPGTGNSQQTLDLNSFLNQVQSGNDQYQSANSLRAGLELRQNEWKLLTRPNLFGTAEYTDDQRLTGAPSFQGRQTKISRYNLGIEQSTTVGVDAKLYYDYMDTEIVGVNPTFFPVPQFIISSPVLELSQSLWRNFGGAEKVALQEVSAAKVQSQKLLATYGLITLRVDAEKAYWRLVVARKMVISAQENLGRAERMLKWSSRRERMSLSDRSDLYQSQAIVAQRQIELQTAIDDEKSAALEFNKMRGIDEIAVPEQLSLIETEQVTSLQLPERNSERLDVKAAAETARANKAAAKLSAEATKPDLKVYARLSLNGRDPEAKTAIDQAWTTNYPMTTVGVKFTMPLSFGLTSDVREGYSAEAKSADLAYRRKFFETDKEWQDLTQKFENAKKRLVLAQTMEKAQKQKMDYERTRHSRGRTTTYQVILFEQDFASAQVARIKLESEILNMFAMLKTFGGFQ
jgi:outer membrane protein TolC